jgi:hypothetical protein
MPSKTTLRRARNDARRGKSTSTQAGEFVREEMEHIRGGKHGARNTKQAIAIGLSKARRAGVRLGAPKRGTTSARTRTQATRDLRKGKKGELHGGKPMPSPTRSRGVLGALKKEGHLAASPRALARQARSSARRRGMTTHPKSAPKSGAKSVSTKRSAKRGMRRTSRKRR